MAATIAWMASSLEPRFGAKPPSSPTAVDRPRPLSTPARAWNTSAPMRSASLEALGAHRHGHELLQVDVVVGVLAAVHDVHHGHRQDVRVAAADVLIEGQPHRRRGGVGHGQRGAEDGVGAELGLVGRAVQGDQGLVDDALVGGVEAEQLLGDLVVHVVDGLVDRLAAVLLPAVAQLDGFELAGRGAGRHRGAPGGARFELDLDLDRGVAAASRGSACRRRRR